MPKVSVRLVRFDTSLNRARLGSVSFADCNLLFRSVVVIFTTHCGKNESREESCDDKWFKMVANRVTRCWNKKWSNFFNHMPQKVATTVTAT